MEERQEPLLRGEEAGDGPAKALAPFEGRGQCARKILRIGAPVAASSVVQWSQGFFTIWLIGGNGTKLSMAAFGLANVVCNVTGHSLLWGLGQGFDTLAPQAWGANERLALGTQGLRVLVLLTLVVNVPVVAVWLNATPLLLALGQDREIAEQVAAFARIRVPGLFCQAISCVLTKALTAMGKTDALLILNVLSVAASASLSWLFIAAESPLSSHFSPIDGSATMSSIVDGAAALVLAAVCFRDADCRSCWPGWSGDCFRGWRAYLALAVPAMVMVIIEWWSWDIVNVLAGLCPDPKTTLAVNALLGNVISLAYCVPCGLQAGTQTLVGNALGGRAPDTARDAAVVGALLGVAAMALQAALLFAFRGAWASLFDSEPDVGRRVTALLKFVVFFNAGDGIQLVLSGVITGAGKQRATTPVLFASYWILGLPLGALAAFKYPRNGLLGLWMGMTAAVWLHVAAYVLICFLRSDRLACTIDWHAAARKAAERLAADSARVAPADDDEAKRGDDDDARRPLALAEADDGAAGEARRGDPLA